MGRPRKHGTNLPPYLYLRHGAYLLVRGNKSESLGRDLGAALAEYANRMSPVDGGMAALLEDAFPAITAKVKARTKKNYRTQVNRLKRVFAAFRPEQIRARHIAKLKLDMAATPNVFNQALSVLRMVFAYAVENQLLDDNPAIAIRRYAEKERERLIDLAEFHAIAEHCDPTMQCLMALLFLTGQRVNDVISIRMGQLTEDGIAFRQQKTEAKLVVAWSPELEDVVARAKELHGDVKSLSLLLNGKGRPLREGVARTRWDKACRKAGVQDAQMRDLRAMSGTAAKAAGLNPTALLGHSTPRTTERYLRAKTTPLVSGPSFGIVLDFGKSGVKKQ